MPSIYAHHKFGKLVILKLPIEIKNIIKKYPRSFRIGLQGPDFLFFYRAFSKNKVNQIGVHYHHNDTYPFMQHALEVIREYGTDSSQYSYILGFICHFALDNACHPYIHTTMNQTGCGHVEIECDLDQMLLTSENFIPERYHLDTLVPDDFYTALSIEPFYENVSVHTIHKALKWMRIIKKLFVAPGFIKRALIDLAMRATFHYKKLVGHVVPPHANRKCRAHTKHIYKLLKLAVNDAANLIFNFDSALADNCLSDAFHKDFNGNIY